MVQVKIAEILARAGLHLGATTVRRRLKEKPLPTPRKTTMPWSVSNEWSPQNTVAKFGMLT